MSTLCPLSNNCIIYEIYSGLDSNAERVISESLIADDYEGDFFNVVSSCIALDEIRKYFPKKFISNSIPEECSSSLDLIAKPILMLKEKF